MDSILFWVGALIVFSVLSPLIKYVIAAVAGKRIGAKALAQQPDRIHLQPGSPASWKNAAAASRIADALLTRAFADGGVYTVPELPGVVVQLMAHAKDGLYAAVYEHPKAGTWFDLVCWTASSPSARGVRSSSRARTRRCRCSSRATPTRSTTGSRSASRPARS